MAGRICTKSLSKTKLEFIDNRSSRTKKPSRDQQTQNCERFEPGCHFKSSEVVFDRPGERSPE